MNLTDRQRILNQIISACEGAQYANRDAWFAKATVDTLLGAITLDSAALRVAAGNAREAADRAKTWAATANDLFGQIPERSGTEAAYALKTRAHEWTSYAITEAARAEQHARVAEASVAQTERGEESTAGA